MTFQYQTVSSSVGASDILPLSDAHRAAGFLVYRWQLTVPPITDYKNLKTPRHKGFYGYCQVMQGEYVKDTVAIDYVDQVLWEYNRADTLTLIDEVACAYKLLKQAVRLYSVAPGVVDNLPESFTVKIPTIQVTSLRFRLLPDVRGNVTLTYGVFGTDCGNTVEIVNGPPIPNPNNSSPSPRPPGEFPDEDPNDPTGNDGDQDEPKPDFGELGGGRYKTTVYFGAPFSDSTEYFAPASEFDTFSLTNLPVRTDAQGCNQARLGGLVNGKLVWQTDNCTSPIENQITVYEPGT